MTQPASKETAASRAIAHIVSQVLLSQLLEELRLEATVKASASAEMANECASLNFDIALTCFEVDPWDISKICTAAELEQTVSENEPLCALIAKVLAESSAQEKVILNFCLAKQRHEFIQLNLSCTVRKVETQASPDSSSSD